MLAYCHGVDHSHSSKGLPSDDVFFCSQYQAAEQGDAEAQYSLGVMYRNGEGVTKDQREAVRWWRKAAEQVLP